MDVFSPNSVLTDDQLKALGQTAAVSAWAEWALEHFIAGLCRLPRLKVEIIMERKMINDKFEALRLLGRMALKSDSKREEFSRLIGLAQEANKERNVMIHGVWHRDDWTDSKNYLRVLLGGATVYKATSPGNFKTRRGHEIQKVAHGLYAHMWDLILFLEDNFPRVKKLPQSSRPKIPSWIERPARKPAKRR